MAARANLYIDQGATFSSDVTVKDLNNNAFDLTGHTAVAKMASGYESTKTRTTISTTIAADPKTGVITLSLTPAQTSAITEGRYVYDLEITSGTGEVTRVIEGIMSVTPQVST